MCQPFGVFRVGVLRSSKLVQACVHKRFRKTCFTGEGLGFGKDWRFQALFVVLFRARGVLGFTVGVGSKSPVGYHRRHRHTYVL